MKTQKTLAFTTCLLALAIAGATQAQQPDFPNERTKPSTCEDFRWNNDMTRDHPRVIDACQETVIADGVVWARLEARFVRVRNDGMVVFSMRGRGDRIIEQMMMEPADGQVAYINDRATEFRNLRASDTLNLYVAEGEYGWATQPVATTARFSRVTAVPADEMEEPAPEVVDQGEQEVVTRDVTPPRKEMVMADNRPLPSRLPVTAGNSYWLALIGGFLVLCGMGVSARRFF
ncbi:MAG: hypothetical protein IPK97_20770 [Ahniella sp.]|nr:hypothetical protein [Ahniella sp.]